MGQAPSRRARSARPTAPVPRRLQQRSADTRGRLIEAALGVFAAHGFEGASTREIARRAGVALAALPYHFTTKDALWRAAADRIFERLASTIAARLDGLDGVDRATQLRLILREFVRFSASHPELHRFMIHEGFVASARLAWLVETHVRPLYDAVRGMAVEAQRAGLAPPGRPEHLHYILIGAATSAYVLRAEYQLLTGDDPCDEERIAAHVATLERMFFPAVSTESPSETGSAPARPRARAGAGSRAR
jgi:AcrR family transcriptional regulator